MLDQRRLPGEVIYHTYTDYRDVAKAIKDMVIRGAPAIGVAAAMGVAHRRRTLEGEDARGTARRIRHDLRHARAHPPHGRRSFLGHRPIQAPLRGTGAGSRESRARPGWPESAPRSSKKRRSLHQERREADERIGRFGAELMPKSGRVMTQCNAGALATGGIGTALGVIRMAVEGGYRIEVLVPETRPYLQGARLTAWELHQDHIPLTLITDNMVGHFLKTGGVSAVVVGADRIARNGDTANKIGTYGIAVLARENKVPFYVAAPISTLDLSIASGEQIPIEERSEEEVTHLAGVRISPDVRAAHPAFDVTPARFIAAIITERGVARAPFEESLQGLVGKP